MAAVSGSVRIVTLSDLCARFARFGFDIVTSCLKDGCTRQAALKNGKQFASGSGPRFPQSFLYQFAPVEAFQLRISPDRVHRCLTPEIAHESVAFLAQLPEPLPASAGALPRDYPDVAGHRFPIREPHGITQEHFGGQAGYRTDS